MSERNNPLESIDEDGIVCVFDDTDISALQMNDSASAIHTLEKEKSHQQQQGKLAIHNNIAAELSCRLSRKLPVDPVVADDGFIYERIELETMNRTSSEVGGHAPTQFYSSNTIKRVIRYLISSGSVDKKYLGDWGCAADGEESDANDLPADKTMDSLHSKGHDSEGMVGLKEQRKEENETFVLTQAKAEEGNVKSMIELGELYLRGCGIGKDDKKAYHWFDRASEEDSNLGTARKADCLLMGVGVAKDYEEGRNMLITAATEDDSVPAALRLWYYHSEGIYGFKKDETKASRKLKFLKESGLQVSDIQQMKQDLIDLTGPLLTTEESNGCEQVSLKSDEEDSTEDSPATASSDMSKNKTGDLVDSNEKDQDCGSSVEAKAGEELRKQKEEKETFLLTQTKAEEGNVQSMVEVGELYLKGCGIEKDDKKAYHWFARASDANSDLGTARKADCLLVGLGVAQDYKEGRSMLLIAAAEDDSATAALRLWYYHSEGINGFQKDVTKASKWLNCLKRMGLKESDIQQMKQDLIDFTRPSSTKRDIFDQAGLPAEERCIEDEQDPTMHEKVINARGEEVCKQCFSCGVSKPKSSFDLIQWNKPLRKGSCIECCTKQDPTATVNKSGGENYFSSHRSNTQCDSAAFQWKQSEDTGGSDPNSRPSPTASTAETESSYSSERDKDNSDQSSPPSEATSQAHVKKCFDCGLSKPQTEFTASQWKKSVGTGICAACVKKSCPSTSSVDNKVDPEKGENQSMQANHAGGSYMKPCFGCGQQKPQPDFTASQWKKKVGTGKCICCVSKSVQWQTSSVGSSLQMKVCGECNVSKAHAEFSPNQWRKSRETGRCKECVMKRLA